MELVMLELKDPALLRQACYIDGEWMAADDGGTVAVANPADGSIVATVPNCGTVETGRAVEAAELAFLGWRETTAAERARILRRWFDLMTANTEDLARIMTAEQGKPLAESKGEIAYA